MKVLFFALLTAFAAFAAEAVTVHRSFRGGYPAGASAARAATIERGGTSGGTSASSRPKTTAGGSAKAPNKLLGKVVRVIDGDTVVIADGTGEVTVELEKIDAPEADQPFGPQATKLISDLAGGKSVEVLWEKRDRKGDILGVVYFPHPQGMVELNLTMIKNGCAWHERSDRTRVYADAEKEARRAKRGLWSDPKPVEPSRWRSRR